MMCEPSRGCRARAQRRHRRAAMIVVRPARMIYYAYYREEGLLQRSRVTLMTQRELLHLQRLLLLMVLVAALQIADAFYISEVEITHAWCYVRASLAEASIAPHPSIGGPNKHQPPTKCLISPKVGLIFSETPCAPPFSGLARGARICMNTNFTLDYIRTGPVGSQNPPFSLSHSPPPDVDQLPLTTRQPPTTPLSISTTVVPSSPTTVSF